MNRIIFLAILTIGIVLITYFTEWWLIVLLCGVLSYFYRGSLKEKLLLVLGLTISIWLIIAGLHEMSTVNKASHLIGKIFKDVSPTVIYTITGMIISIPSILATVLGHRLQKK
jgi:hypothetical protein